MPTFKKEEVTCAICGHTNTVLKCTSLSAFGHSDLDYRPPMPARAAKNMLLQECENCRYTNNRISRVPLCKYDKAKKLIASKKYQSPDKYGDIPESAKKHIRRALIAKAEGRTHSLWEYYLNAAWVCDDAGKEKAAKALRKKAAHLLYSAYRPPCGRQNKVRLSPFSRPNPAQLTLIYADMLRRSGQFLKLKARLSKTKLADKRLNAALAFETDRAKAHDLRRYRFSDDGTFPLR